MHNLDGRQLQRVHYLLQSALFLRTVHQRDIEHRRCNFNQQAWKPAPADVDGRRAYSAAAICPSSVAVGKLTSESASWPASS
jgi:hypothetical protein